MYENDERIASCSMDSMLSDSTLEIPKDVLAILAAVDGKPYSKAVWTLAKHRSGYSLKLFWGVEQKSVTRGHDSESSSHYRSCTVVESTSLKEPPSETFDTTTNSATTLKLTQVDASSTGGHESGPSTLASSDEVSASQALPTSKVLHIDCPVSSRTRSKVKKHQSDQDLGNDSTTVLPSNPKSSVSNARPPSVRTGLAS